MPVLTNEMVWESVAVPLMEGLDVNTRARLVEPTKLLEAVNVFFPRGGGPEKRPGHFVETVRDLRTPQPGIEDAVYIYGYGWATEASVYTGTPQDISSWPDAGPILGVAHRDNEELEWDGWRLFKKTSSGFALNRANRTNYYDTTPNPTCYLPTARTSTIGKTQNSQAYSDLADTGVIRVLAFRDLLAGNVRIKCYDSVSGTLKFESTSNITVDPEYIKVINCGTYVHVLVSDASTNEIYMDTIREWDSSFQSTGQTIASTARAYFDVAKINETRWIFAYVDTSGGIHGAYFNANGTQYTLGPPAGTLFDTGGANALAVGIDVHPVTAEVGLVWRTVAPVQGARIYNASFVALNAVYSLSTDANCSKVTIVATYVRNAGGVGVFHTYSDNTLTTNRFIRLRTVASDSAGVQDYGIRYNVNLVSKPFRVGNVPFLIACFPSDFQTTYLLLDNNLNPAGKLEYGTASNNTSDPWLFSVNRVEETNLYETVEFHCALMWKQRVLEQDGVFHEISTKFLELDFLPEFRRVQAGRALYFPGAQLNSYDGESVTEANFHFAIEEPTAVVSNSTGSLTNNGVYYYRIYQCHKNAQGEEVRGPAILTAGVTLGAADDTVTLTGKTLPTAKDGSYFLVYRNANAGTVWYLVSDRDPASANCPKNAFDSATWTFVDTVSDVVAATNELDPANAANYLHSFSAPACETIAYGLDRVWLSGGELPAGTILPSRLFAANEVPSYHLNLGYSIDRAADQITGIGFQSTYLLAFTENLGYIVDGSPADNVSEGDTLRNQKVLSDVGCISHNSIARLSAGIVFQAEGGIRLVEPGGALRTIGIPVDSLCDYITDSVLDTANRLIKFYQASTDTLVFDYEAGQWTIWSVRAKSASKLNLGINNELWTVDSNSYLDGDATYLYSFRTAHIGPSLGGFYRLRRIAGIGEADDSYTITVKLRYNEGPVYEQFTESGIANTSTWGSGTWGSGFWGDASGTSIFANDSQWKWKHRVAKQKCSCVSVEVIYNGTGKGPVHTALIFELGRKAGLDRMGKSN